MRAVVYKKTGPPEVLHLEEVEKPTPQPDEVLVKIHAATVTSGDVMLRKLKFPLTILFRIFGMPRKKIPGHEFAGEIEAVGRDVTLFKEGDAVFGTTTGLSVGSYAEYVCVPQEWDKGMLAIKPDKMSFEEAAPIPVGGNTALYILNEGSIENGGNVLIYGASGSVGTYAVQLARHFEAKVTGVSSTKNLDLVKSLGAERVIDYTQEDFTQEGRVYDIIFDAVGKISSSRSKKALKEGGIYLSVASTTSEKTENLIFLKELIEAGELKAVIDRCYPLEQIVEAHRYVETGRKKGNVVITLNQGNSS